MSDLNKDELLAKAHELGVRVQSNWKPETIEAAIARHLEDEGKQGDQPVNLDPEAVPFAEAQIGEATDEPREGIEVAEGETGVLTSEEPETLLGVVAAEEPESSTEGNGDTNEPTPRERAAAAGLQLPEEWDDEQVVTALAEFELSLDDAPPELEEPEYPTGHSPRG